MKNKLTHQSWFQSMVITLTLVMVMVLVACNDSKATKPEFTEEGYHWVHHNIIEIDGCEYIESVGGTQRYSLTHKGNCQSGRHFN